MMLGVSGPKAQIGRMLEINGGVKDVKWVNHARPLKTKEAGAA